MRNCIGPRLLRSCLISFHIFCPTVLRFRSWPCSSLQRNHLIILSFDHRDISVSWIAIDNWTGSLVIYEARDASDPVEFLFSILHDHVFTPLRLGIILLRLCSLEDIPGIDLSIVFRVVTSCCSLNLLSFLLRCGTRPYERGTQWDSNSLV